MKLHTTFEVYHTRVSEEKTPTISLTEDDDEDNNEDTAGRCTMTIAYGLLAGKLKIDMV